MSKRMSAGEKAVRLALIRTLQREKIDEMESTHLEFVRVVAGGAYTKEDGGWLTCIYCDEMMNYLDEHEPGSDCPHVKAKAILEKRGE